MNRQVWCRREEQYVSLQDYCWDDATSDWVPRPSYASLSRANQLWSDHVLAREYSSAALNEANSCVIRPMSTRIVDAQRDFLPQKEPSMAASTTTSIRMKRTEAVKMLEERQALLLKAHKKVVKAWRKETQKKLAEALSRGNAHDPISLTPPHPGGTLVKVSQTLKLWSASCDKHVAMDQNTFLQLFGNPETTNNVKIAADIIRDAYL